jgi:hypothetical protein
MTLEEYELIKVYQGGVCPGCRRSNGATKALAVEHDHKIARESCDHPEKESCINCWRGLMCGPCNDILAWLHDDVMAFYRFISFLRNPPAQALRHAIVDSSLMPCIKCGERRCQLGVATCDECDKPTLRVDRQKMNMAYLEKREKIQYRPGE